jgi:hypothetical protein
VRAQERDRLGISARERIVGWGTSRGTGVVVATDRALYGAGDRLPWHRIAKAQWREPVLEIIVGDQPPTVLRLAMDDARDLPQAVHACVTESVIVSERLDLGDDRGALAAARRTDTGDVAWLVVFDAGLDPTDPALRARADAALADLRSALGV